MSSEKMSAYDAVTKIREEIEKGAVASIDDAYIDFESLIGRIPTTDELLCVQNAWVAVKGEDSYDDDESYDDDYYDSSSEDYY